MAEIDKQKVVDLLNRILEQELAPTRSVMLEEYARQMVHAEEIHAGEVDKMMRKPGEIKALRPVQRPWCSATK